MTELKPCRCGCTTPRIISYGFTDTWRISCPKCSYCTKEKLTKTEAVKAWNITADNGRIDNG